jgi:hypothetical protein
MCKPVQRDMATGFDRIPIAAEPADFHRPGHLQRRMALDLAKQFRVSIKVATRPHERLAGLHDDSVFAMSPFLQFANAINANQ